jgi:hypothetical protein
MAAIPKTTAGTRIDAILGPIENSKLPFVIPCSTLLGFAALRNPFGAAPQGT